MPSRWQAAPGDGAREAAFADALAGSIARLSDIVEALCKERLAELKAQAGE